jgi:Myosin head (motor domain)
MQASAGATRVNIDIVTGRELINVYFDPQRALDAEGIDDDWLATHLYEPASIIKEDNGILTVRLVAGERVFKMTSGSQVTEQDAEGVDDILKLREFSEMSLIHSLRVRYARDDIYTFVGPILISINPYKWFKDLYSEESMAEYHQKSQVGRIPSRDARLLSLY